MSLTYASLQSEIQLLTQYNAADPAFTANFPNALDYAQDRIYRELDLLNTVTSVSSLKTTANLRTFSFSAAGINVLQDVNIITPFTTTNPELGTRNSCTISDKSLLNAVYNSPATVGTPVNFAFLDNQTLLFGPWPDQAYTVELIGTLNVTSPVLQLSPTNTTTFVSTYLPDLLIAGCMIQFTGFMKNFGAQSDNPQMAVSWEDQFSKLRDSAAVEDARRRFQSAGATSEQPKPTLQRS